MKLDNCNCWSCTPIGGPWWCNECQVYHNVFSDHETHKQQMENLNNRVKSITEKDKKISRELFEKWKAESDKRLMKKIEKPSIVQEILDERVRQDSKWGQQDHSPMKWCAILMEETGETAQASLQRKYNEYRKELIQVAAVAIAAIECLDRDVWS